MKVYVLVAAAPYEGQTFLGAYSTRELAKRAARTPELVSSDVTAIFEADVDAAPRYHFEGRDDLETVDDE